MNQFVFYLAAFGLILGVLIVVHELGHYLVARWVGVKVLRFSFGFGRPLWSMRFGRDATEWAIGAFPLGGYDKMLDEREGEVPRDELPRSFNRQSVGRRMAIVAAGPLANLLLAVVVYWGIFIGGTEEPRPLLGTPVAASAAAAAGFSDGERVLKVGSEPVETWQDMRWNVLRQAAEHDSVEIEVINARQEITFRRLDLAAVRDDGWEGDGLEKLGLRFYRPRLPAVIGRIAEDGPADLAGLRAGDEILSIDGEPVAAWPDVVEHVRAAPGKALELEVKRAASVLKVSVTPRLVEDAGVPGVRIGRIGAVVADDPEARSDLMVTVAYDPLTALGKAIEETWDKSVFTVAMIGKMIVGEVSWRNISGPITIADYAGQSAQLGLHYYLKFMALVSISLAVLNLLPVPILDGGHLLYHVLEIIKRGPLSERTIEIGQRIGLALMLMLMAFAFYNDINRLISS